MSGLIFDPPREGDDVAQLRPRLRRALSAFERSARINPRHIPSRRPVRATDQVEALRREVKTLETLERGLLKEAEPVDLAPGSRLYHSRLAALLEERGEALLAPGHKLLAMGTGD